MTYPVSGSASNETSGTSRQKCVLPPHFVLLEPLRITPVPFCQLGIVNDSETPPPPPPFDGRAAAPDRSRCVGRRSRLVPPTPVAYGCTAGSSTWRPSNPRRSAVRRARRRRTRRRTTCRPPPSAGARGCSRPARPRAGRPRSCPSCPRRCGRPGSCGAVDRVEHAGHRGRPAARRTCRCGSRPGRLRRRAPPGRARPRWPPPPAVATAAVDLDRRDRNGRAVADLERS